MRYVSVIVGLIAAFLAGTVAHEATHYAAVHLVGGRVDHVHWLPPEPEVWYEAPTARGDALVRVAPIIISVPLLVGAIILLRDRAFAWQVAGAVTLAAYLPRSQTDWLPVARILIRVATQR